MPLFLNTYKNGSFVFQELEKRGNNISISSNANFASNQNCWLQTSSISEPVEITFDLGDFMIYPYSYLMKGCQGMRMMKIWEVYGRLRPESNWELIDYRDNVDYGLAANPIQVEIPVQRHRGPFRFVKFKLLEDLEQNSSDIRLRLNYFEIKEQHLDPICTCETSSVYHYPLYIFALFLGS